MDRSIKQRHFPAIRFILIALLVFFIIQLKSEACNFRHFNRACISFNTLAFGSPNSTSAKPLRTSKSSVREARISSKSPRPEASKASVMRRRLQNEEQDSGSDSSAAPVEGLSVSEKRTRAKTKQATNPPPFWNIPNVLTMLRVVAIPVFSIIFFTNVEWRNAASSGIFAGAAITDWLDGYLARKWNVSSPFGAFLDPVADKLMVSTALILITGRLSDWKFSACCSIILAREIGVSALREWMAQIGERGKVAVGYAGKVKTATTMVSLVLLLLMQPGASTYGIPQVGFTLGMWLMYISTVLTVTSGWGYLKAAWPALTGKSV